MVRMRAETAYSLVIVLLLAGLAFSTYAWYETVNPAARGVCSFGSYFSCAKIDTSGDTTTLGLPDWGIGVAGYVVMLFLGILAYSTYKRPHLLAVTAVSGLGVAISAYFAYIELVIIQGICVICLGAYLCNLAAFLLLVFLVRLTDEKEPVAAPSAPDARSA
jgi:uncharacterized membrane protein